MAVSQTKQAPLDVTAGRAQSPALHVPGHQARQMVGRSGVRLSGLGLLLRHPMGCRRPRPLRFHGIRSGPHLHVGHGSGRGGFLHQLGHIYDLSGHREAVASGTPHDHGRPCLPGHRNTLAAGSAPQLRPGSRNLQRHLLQPPVVPSASRPAGPATGQTSWSPRCMPGCSTCRSSGSRSRAAAW